MYKFTPLTFVVSKLCVTNEKKKQFPVGCIRLGSKRNSLHAVFSPVCTQMRRLSACKEGGLTS